MNSEFSKQVYVNVLDYLGANTGEDLSDAIQKIILDNPKKVIFFPDGEYLLAKPICTPANPEHSVCLHLSNYATLKAMDSWCSDEAMVRLGAAEPFNSIYINGSNYYFSGGIIDGNGIAKGISIDSGRETRVESVSIKNTLIGLHVKWGANSGSSDADITGFLKDFPYEEWKDLGLRCLITGNHDTKRCSFNLNDMERRLAYAFIFTMPGAPFLYYGDEIGMAYRWLPTKEGGYHRTGSRSPMQWTNGENLGFSNGKAEDLYLPVDPNPNGTTVESQEADPNSMLHHVRSLIALRHAHEDLGNYSPFQVYHIGKRLFAYQRGSYLAAVNPGLVAEGCKLEGKYEVIFSMGDVRLDNGELTLGKQSFAVLKPIA